MSKSKSKIKSQSPKKVVTSTKSKRVVTSNKQSEKTEEMKGAKKRLAPTKSKKRKQTTVSAEPLLFGKQNYVLMGIGLGLITLGLVLMSGGAMPSPDVWDENIIYGFRRTVLAPFLMLAGLIVEVVAIFKK